MATAAWKKWLTLGVTLVVVLGVLEIVLRLREHLQHW